MSDANIYNTTPVVIALFIPIFSISIWSPHPLIHGTKTFYDMDIIIFFDLDTKSIIACDILSDALQ
jgi:hypothetical protein